MKVNQMKKVFGALAMSLLAMWSLLFFVTRAGAQQVGEVSTVFKLLSPNDKIVVDAYDDPKVAGVTCYVSRAKTGGYKGALGLAEDKSEASIASDRPHHFCKTTGHTGGCVVRAHFPGFQKAQGRAHGRCTPQHAGVSDLFRPLDRRLTAKQRHRCSR